MFVVSCASSGFSPPRATSRGHRPRARIAYAGFVLGQALIAAVQLRAAGESLRSRAAHLLIARVGHALLLSMRSSSAGSSKRDAGQRVSPIVRRGRSASGRAACIGKPGIPHGTLEPCSRRRARLRRQRGRGPPCPPQTHPTASSDPVHRQARDGKQRVRRAGETAASPLLRPPHARRRDSWSPRRAATSRPAGTIAFATRPPRSAPLLWRQSETPRRRGACRPRAEQLLPRAVGTVPPRARRPRQRRRNGRAGAVPWLRRTPATPSGCGSRAGRGLHVVATASAVVP